MKFLNKFLYCGQDKGFIKNNRREIYDNNMKIMRGVNVVMIFIILIYLIFDLNSSHEINFRYLYLVIFTIYSFLLLLSFSKFSTSLKFQVLYILLVYEVAFGFLLLTEPIFDSERGCVFLPIFFAISFLLVIESFIVVGSIVTLNLIASIIVEFLFKEQELAIYDIINLVTSFLIGIIIGYSVVISRAKAIVSYNLLKKSSETELSRALQAANTDSLTLVNSRSAYERDEAIINQKIEKKEIKEFGIVVADINNLKECNDNYGHDVGDKLIISVAEALTQKFNKNYVYRIGGDEFVVILLDSDYSKINALMAEIKKDLETRNDEVSFATGVALFKYGRDKCLNDVFIRADIAMYDRKKMMKKRGGRSF